MKRYALIVCAALGLTLSSGMPARASWGALGYGGYQPWWNVFAHRPKCLTCEDERLQKFWHDYYDAIQRYYASLGHVDWVAYYRSHGYGQNGACPGGACPGQGAAPGMPGMPGMTGMTGMTGMNYPPGYPNPNMQWAVPTGGYPAGANVPPPTSYPPDGN
jgi:hypothetical protein